MFVGRTLYEGFLRWETQGMLNFNADELGFRVEGLKVC